MYEYTSQRKRLYTALEADDAATLVHPVLCPGGMLAMCERFSMTESRERGGYTQFEMAFVEGGKAVSALGVGSNARAAVESKSEDAEEAGKTVFDNGAAPLVGSTQSSVV